MRSLGTVGAFSSMSFSVAISVSSAVSPLAAGGVAGKEHGPAPEEQPNDDASRVALLALAEFAPPCGWSSVPGDYGDDCLAETIQGSGRQVGTTEIDDLSDAQLRELGGAVRESTSGASPMPIPAGRHARPPCHLVRAWKTCRQAGRAPSVSDEIPCSGTTRGSTARFTRNLTSWLTCQYTTYYT